MKRTKKLKPVFKFKLNDENISPGPHRSMVPLGELITKHLFLNQLRDNKPLNFFIGGVSGSGKSWGALRLCQTLFPEIINKPESFLDECVIYVRKEYKRKIDNFFFGSDNKWRVLIYMESRDVAAKHKWWSELNQVVADVSALSRTEKPVLFIVISQHFQDIDVNLRRVFNYLAVTKRSGRTPPWMYLRVGDTVKTAKTEDIINDLPSPWGWIEKNGRKKRVILSCFRLGKPDKTFREMFEEFDKNAKRNMLKKRLRPQDDAVPTVES